MYSAQKTSKLLNSNSRYLSYSKGLGTFAGIAGTLYSGYKVIDANLKGQKADFLDKLDLGVGLTSAVATGVISFGLTTNPAGWSVLAISTTIYSGFRVGMDIYNYSRKP